MRFFFSSRRRHTRFDCDWSSDVCSSDLNATRNAKHPAGRQLHVSISYFRERSAALVAGKTQSLSLDYRSPRGKRRNRSEEHTSELQSQSNLVCRLLLEKKKTNNYNNSLT